MRNYILLFCMPLLIVACGKSSSNESLLFQNESPQEIDLATKPKTADGLSFIDMLDNISYVPLEAKSNTLIARGSKVIANNNRFIVLDRSYSSANVFDAGGKHLFSIGAVGHGPGEFLRLDDMDVDTVNNQILLWSNDNRAILKYSLTDGKFVEQIRTAFFGGYFGILGDKYITYTDYNMSKKGEAKNLFISDQKGAANYSYFPFPEKMFTAAFSFTGFLSKNDKGFLYAHALSDTVYQISEDLKVFPKYHFDLGDKAWTKHFGIFDHQEFMAKGMEYSILHSGAFEWGDYFFFTFQQNAYVKKGFRHSGKNEIYTSDNLKDDFDFELFNIPVGRDGSLFISVIYPDTFFNLKAKYPDFEERVAKNPSLKKIADSIRVDSNPILMLYSMK